MKPLVPVGLAEPTPRLPGVLAIQYKPDECAHQRQIHPLTTPADLPSSDTFYQRSLVAAVFRAPRSCNLTSSGPSSSD